MKCGKELEQSGSSADVGPKEMVALDAHYLHL